MKSCNQVKYGTVLAAEEGVSPTSNFLIPTRPCYWMLRGLGIWQPQHSNVILRCYTKFTPLIAFGCAIAFVCLDLIHASKNEKITSRLGEILNSMCTTVDLICPYLFCRYYFVHRKSYDRIIEDASKLPLKSIRRIKCISRVYTFVMTLMWFGCGIFFYYHWKSFFSRPWHHVIYSLSLFYATGWWASWLTVYGFVCAVHSVQSYDFVDRLKDSLSKSNGNDKTETKAVSKLLIRYNELQTMLDATQKDLGFIISMAVIYHVIDIAVFSYAYWNSDFGERYPLWQYGGGITYDLISIFAKLYPAGIVSRSTQQIAKEAGLQCKPFITNDHGDSTMPNQRLALYNHLVVRETHMGLRILGINISLGFTIGLIVTIITTAASILRFAVPHIGGF